MKAIKAGLSEFKEELLANTDEREQLNIMINNTTKAPATIKPDLGKRYLVPERKYLLTNGIDKTMALNCKGCWMTVVSRPDPTYRVHVGWIRSVATSSNRSYGCQTPVSFGNTIGARIHLFLPFDQWN